MASRFNSIPLLQKFTALPPMAPSPTLNRKLKIKPMTTTTMSKEPSRLPAFSSTTTPPSPLRPSTPPRKTACAQYLQLSPVRTPLSHRGLHMSPSASLAHYKSNLDPPPPLAPTSVFSNSDLGGLLALPDSESTRTPSRKRPSSSLNPASSNISLFPVTPKKLIFPTANSSYYPQDSPFRTPGSRPSIFDPHDPGALVDEELSRLGAQIGGQDSPVGLYEGRRGLLYESPSMPSPGKWTKWW